MFDPGKHNYYKKLVELYERGLVPPGGLADVAVYHDDWCRTHRGGYCDCDPEVEVQLLPELD
jgi:hypothetical protein